MNWEEISAISTFITMIVIAASAIAAVIQLRHMRAGNAITGFLGFMDKWSSPEAREIANYVFGDAMQRKLADPAYREELLSTPLVDRLRNPEFQYLDFWESIGGFLKLGYFAEDVVMESGGPVAVRAWPCSCPSSRFAARCVGRPFTTILNISSRAQLCGRANTQRASSRITPRTLQ